MAWCLWQQPHPGAPQSPRRRTKDMPGAQGSPRDSGSVSEARTRGGEQPAPLPRPQRPRPSQATGPAVSPTAPGSQLVTGGPEHCPRLRSSPVPAAGTSCSAACSVSGRARSGQLARAGRGLARHDLRAWLRSPPVLPWLPCRARSALRSFRGRTTLAHPHTVADVGCRPPLD